jgi:hypothetical protein
VRRRPIASGTPAPRRAAGAHAGAPRRPDQHAAQSREDLKLLGRAEPAPRAGRARPRRSLRPTNVPADIAATLLYPVTDRPFRELYELACAWSERQRAEVIDVALAIAHRRDEILAGFRGGLYAYDMVIDIGASAICTATAAARNSARPTQRQPGLRHAEAGHRMRARGNLRCRHGGRVRRHAPPAGARGDYLLPFGARSRFLFKMDFAEAEYIARSCAAA